MEWFFFFFDADLNEFFIYLNIDSLVAQRASPVAQTVKNLPAM